MVEPRERWGSSQTDPAGSPVGIANEIVIHHAYRPHVDADVDADYERRVMRSIEDYHVNTRGWDDIGYTFLVFQSGRAYEGRGWFRSGAHTAGRNDVPAICFVIDGDVHTPTEAAWNTAAELCREGVAVGALTVDYRVSGHTDYSAKSCPGTVTYPLIQRLAPGNTPEDNGELTMSDIDTILERLAALEAKVDDIPQKTWGYRIGNVVDDGKTAAYNFLRHTNANINKLLDR